MLECQMGVETQLLICDQGPSKYHTLPSFLQHAASQRKGFLVSAFSPPEAALQPPFADSQVRLHTHCFSQMLPQNLLLLFCSPQLHICERVFQSLIGSTQHECCINTHCLNSSVHPSSKRPRREENCCTRRWNIGQKNSLQSFAFYHSLKWL